MEGSVKWYNKQKGYGFVIGEDGKEYFVHHTSLARGSFLRENDRVSFEPAENERGVQAKNVTLLQKGSELGGSSSKSESTEETTEGASEGSEDSDEDAEEEGDEEESEEF
ncbi:MAG: cold shock domain-containing protein [Candidatus Woesearchaeota archaeon]